MQAAGQFGRLKVSSHLRHGFKTLKVSSHLSVHGVTLTSTPEMKKSKEERKLQWNRKEQKNRKKK
jgi:hypothetical protein